ncbi:PrgI family protein [Spongiactinospora sp. 9N601]|uniref:PrgI family protein n=1 Tax=Spongiactinospora sp. 9N601 TaxID=3375149 RepID=UPI0037AA5458
MTTDGIVRIPADIDQPDKIVWGLTARQTVILAVTAVLLYGEYAALGERLPLAAALALPIVVAGVLLAFGTRDGVGLDQYALAALHHVTSRKHLIPEPSEIPAPAAWIAARKAPRAGPLRLPARGVTEDGLIDLGDRDGVAAVAEVSTVSFALRTPDEQDELVAVFARWLHSLSGSVQILVRAERTDLTPTIEALLHQARDLPRPALTTAAQQHAAFLTDLADRHELLRRRVLLVVREQSAGRALRRIEEATRVLNACGLDVRLLDRHALTTCFDTERPGGAR